MTLAVIRPAARREIERIRSFIAKDNFSAAQHVVNRIHEAIESLVRNPLMGHEAVRRDLRVFVAYPYPYLIYYRYLPKRDEVVVVSIRHAARRRTVELREHAPDFRLAVS